MCTSSSQCYQPQDRQATERRVHTDRDAVAWSTMIHLIFRLLFDRCACNKAIKRLSHMIHSGSICYLLVSLPFSMKAGLCGNFDVQEGESGALVVKSLHAKLLEVVEVSLSGERRNAYAVFKRLETRAQKCSPHEVQFVVSLQALLSWVSDGVKFQSKPLSTYWKFWASKGSKELLGEALIKMLSRAENRARRRAEYHAPSGLVQNADAMEEEDNGENEGYTDALTAEVRRRCRNSVKPGKDAGKSISSDEYTSELTASSQLMQEEEAETDEELTYEDFSSAVSMETCEDDEDYGPLPWNNETSAEELGLSLGQFTVFAENAEDLESADFLHM